MKLGVPAIVGVLGFALAAWPAAAKHHGHHGQHGQPPQSGGDRIGQVTFPISCPPAAQKPFERSVALLQSLWYLEAAKGFTQVTQLDPQCAIGYWGIAGPDLLHAARHGRRVVGQPALRADPARAFLALGR